MKRLSLTLLVISGMIQYLSAEKLPDGTVVGDSLIEKAHKQYREYSFNSPVSLNTPLGKKNLKYIHFNTDRTIDTIRFSSEDKVLTPAGEVSASEVQFYHYGSKPYISKAVLAGDFTIKIPAGSLYLQKNDSVSFDCFGHMHDVTMSGKRKLESGDSVLMVSGSIIKNAGDVRFYITLAEPAVIKTSAGKLKFIEKIMYNLDGKMLSGKLEKPQKAVTPQGKLTVTGLSFHPEGGVSYCTLAAPEVLDTLWGKMKLTGNVRFAENGKVDSGRCDGIQKLSFSFGECRVNGSFYFDHSVMWSDFDLAEDTEISTPFGRLVITKGFGTHPGGSMAWFTPANEVKVKTAYGEFINKGGKAMGLYPDGKPAYFNISEPVTINTHSGKLSVSRRIHLYNDGTLGSAEIESPVVIKSEAGNLTVKGFVGFSNNGKVKFASLEKKAMLKTAAGNLAVQGYAEFDEKGSFIEGKLASPAKIRGISYRAGSVIKLNDKGEVTSPMPGK
jgi:hypothetical protein